MLGDLVHLVDGAGVVVGEHLERDPVLLLRPADLVVELGVVQRQAAVDREDLERVLVVLEGEEGKNRRVEWNGRANRGDLLFPC